MLFHLFVWFLFKHVCVFGVCYLLFTFCGEQFPFRVQSDPAGFQQLGNNHALSMLPLVYRPQSLLQGWPFKASCLCQVSFYPMTICQKNLAVPEPPKPY